jgi:hypothetical protein
MLLPTTLFLQSIARAMPPVMKSFCYSEARARHRTLVKFAHPPGPAREKALREHDDFVKLIYGRKQGSLDHA